LSKIQRVATFADRHWAGRRAWLVAARSSLAASIVRGVSRGKWPNGPHSLIGAETKLNECIGLLSPISGGCRSSDVLNAANAAMRINLGRELNVALKEVLGE